MRKYSTDIENKIRLGRLVREWTRSGLLDKKQQEQIAPDLKVSLARTNAVLRLILFVFGSLLIDSAIGLVFIGLKPSESAMGGLFLMAGVACLLAAECLAGFLYRFGLEEAAAIGGILFLGLAGGTFAATSYNSHETMLVGLLVASAAALVAYIRFGYVYAAIISMFCIGVAPVAGLSGSEASSRCVSGLVLTAVFLVARAKRRTYGEEFPGNEYGIIQACAWVGIYVAMNLEVFSFNQFFFSVPNVPRGYYWFTYALIWLLPAIGLYLALRARDRPLLDANIALALATLATNKLYLQMPRQTWDPIVLGVVLIVTAVLLRRWLASGERHGFTASRLLSSDKRKLGVVSTASALLHTGSASAAQPHHDTFRGEGGTSGGAGASGSF